MRTLLAAMCLALAVMSASPALAVLPDEILEDPVLEERARDLSAGLRCLVCRNESIDESNAGLARDMRLLVRERLVAGDSDAEVIAFLVERYGEYVLLQPETSGSNILLWAAGPVMLVFACALGWSYLRARSGAGAARDDSLSAEEQERLRRILDE